MAPAAARRRGGDGAAVLRQGFAKHYGGGGGVGEGEGGNQRHSSKALLLPLYIVEAKGQPNTRSSSPVGAALSSSNSSSTSLLLSEALPEYCSSINTTPSCCCWCHLPRPQPAQEIEGRHRAEHVLNAEVPYVWCLDRLDREDVQLHQPRY